MSTYWRQAIFRLSTDLSEAEVLREILLDENGEPRDGVSFVQWDDDSPAFYIVPAEMLEADDG